MSGVPLPPDTSRNDPPVRLASVSERPRIIGRIPSPITSLIGREEEIASITALFREGHARLVVLTGPGGVGKTRLALHLAHELQDTFADGVWFVPMAAVTRSARVTPTIARALGVWESSLQPIEERLQSLLEDQHALLVIDNVEQVIGAAPHFGTLLASCLHVSMLVTSRSVLHLTGEHDVSLGPLSVPANAGIDALVTSHAVRLFAERARAVRSDFIVTEANAADVAAICRRVDGLPGGGKLARQREGDARPSDALCQLPARAHDVQVFSISPYPRKAMSRVVTRGGARGP